MINTLSGMIKPLAETARFNEDSELTWQCFYGEKDQVLPLLLQPASPSVNLTDWLKGGNKAQFEQELYKHGGILLRGFGVDTVARFNDFMSCFNTEPLPYIFRSSPRQELDKSIRNIYRSTSYPNDRSINMHNESSYSRTWGMKIIFCCIQPSLEGGETPIADSRNVLRDIDPKLVAKFRTKGIRYRRNLLPDLGMPWQEVFQTEDRKAVESVCRANNIKHQFVDEDHLIIEWNKPAVYKHPVSGEETWFNHVFFFHKLSRYEELGLSYDDFLPDEYLTSQTFFGDGTEISCEEYISIKEAYRKNTVAIPYQKGDIIFLDNMLAAHGRNPYKGDRTIATAIIEVAGD